MTGTDLFEALCETDPAQKGARVAALDLAAVLCAESPETADAKRIPGRPARPELVPPRVVPNRGLGTQVGRAAMVHAVAHIEFNAINLALDAAWRFRGLPEAYYADWLSVAQDEARHYAMLAGRLVELGMRYGDFAAHNGLWEAAEQTAQDVLIRMALVPRVLEARGLDVTPGMIHRLEEVGDKTTADILRVILSEEIRHVGVGTHWFRYLCAQRGVDPTQTFRTLLSDRRNHLRGPLNWPAREAAGFLAEELETGEPAAGC